MSYVIGLIRKIVCWTERVVGLVLCNKVELHFYSNWPTMTVENWR